MGQVWVKVNATTVAAEPGNKPISRGFKFFVSNPIADSPTAITIARGCSEITSPERRPELTQRQMVGALSAFAIRRRTKVRKVSGHPILEALDTEGCKAAIRATSTATLTLNPFIAAKRTDSHTMAPAAIEFSIREAVWIAVPSVPVTNRTGARSIP
jgi:hypothetical protein